jgi:hypothetical protein
LSKNGEAIKLPQPIRSARQKAGNEHQWNPPFQRVKEKRLAWKYARCIPLNHTGGAAALALQARINSAKSPRIMPVRDVLSLSLRAHIGAFVSAAAAKCVSSATMDPLSD